MLNNSSDESSDHGFIRDIFALAQDAFAHLQKASELGFFSKIAINKVLTEKSDVLDPVWITKSAVKSYIETF